jgi:hypothetical protein
MECLTCGKSFKTEGTLMRHRVKCDPKPAPKAEPPPPQILLVDPETLEVVAVPPTEGQSVPVRAKQPWNKQRVGLRKGRRSGKSGNEKRTPADGPASLQNQTGAAG